MTRLKSSIIVFFLLLGMSFSIAQIDSFEYNCELNNIQSDWHSIDLPDEMYSQLQNGISDIRIYGITSSSDTVEAPYLLQISKDQTENKLVNSEIINVSHTGNHNYFTVKIPNEDPINFLKLNFGADNFDCNIDLEGSQDQKEWTTILNDYRILSIRNDLTNYQFSTLKFPRSEYTYYRIKVKSKDNPEILGVKSQLTISKEGNKRHYNDVNVSRVIAKDKNVSTYDIVLPTAIPLEMIELRVSNTHDFYRHMDIQYCTDSIVTDSVTHYKYRNISNVILSSFEPKLFTLKGVISDRIRLKVRDNDNNPLDIASANLSASIHSLTVRFDTPGSYSMHWGNGKVRTPGYDLANFKNAIPTNLTALKLGPTNKSPKSEATEKETEALFDHKYWLWSAIIISILVLGVFSFKMLRNS